MRISREGYGIITVTFLVSVVILGAFIYWLPGWPVYIALAVLLYHFLFTIYFFREPSRPHITDQTAIFAPADGKVVVVEKVTDTEYLDKEMIQISVFMSIWNVHANFYPMAGKVEYFKYHPGKFLVAWHPKSSEENERTTTVVDNGRHRILFRQIAGLIARRIVSYAKPGTMVDQNTKCGFIKFGSRVDVLVPPDSEILVSIGDKVQGSQTPIARLK